MKTIILLVIITLTPAAVANRCVSEASFAVAECACTVRNRIDAGWSRRKVLSAYYAADGVATPAQVEQVAAVLDGRASCDPDLYFMYGAGDVMALGLERYTPALVVQNGGKEVRFYRRWFRRDE